VFKELSDDTMDKIVQKYAPQKVALPLQVGDSNASCLSRLNDATLLEKASKAKNGDVFQRLMSGECVGYNSQSEADLALLSILKFWTGNDSEQMKRIFCQSGLYETISRKSNPEDYLNRTIQAAIEKPGDTYKPRQGKRKTARAQGGQEQAQQSADNRSVITWNEANLPEIVHQAEDAMIAANCSGKNTLIFQRGGSLVRIGKATSTTTRCGAIKSPDANVIFPITSNYLQNFLTKIIRWQKWNERKQEFVDCACPKKVADILLEKQGEYRTRGSCVFQGRIERQGCWKLDKKE